MAPRARKLVHVTAVTLMAAFCAVAVGAVSSTPEPSAATIPTAPAGLGAIALDGRVGLAWQQSADATSYTVYRGTSQDSITTPVSPAGHAQTTFADTSAANGQTYYYVVRASNANGQSSVSQVVAATPRGRSCSSANAIVLENCFPGTTDWKMTKGTRAYDGGIEGFTSSPSVNRGGAVDLKIKATTGAPYHIEIYRTGHYGGTQGRLVSQVRGLVAEYQPPCQQDASGTGVYDCGAWSVSTRLTTSADWPSGVYLLKLVRDDAADVVNEMLLIVRDDGSSSDVLYQVPTTTYQAYNGYGGKSVYEFSSSGANTITGTRRAAKVSLNRPYDQPVAGSFRFDWYTRADVAAVSWLEQQGYDASYIADEDLHANGAQAQNHDVVIFGVHDEYWSQQMRDAAEAARDAGTSLLFLGANSAYWRIRFEQSLADGRAGRVEVVYKTIQSGPVDPVSSTSTFRDPGGPNQPENALLGQMYVGDNSSKFFPLRVSAQEGNNRIWRYTSLMGQAPGATASVGSQLVGWEWDQRVSNGDEPAGVETVASSPVTGNLVQGNGASYATGPAIQQSTVYTAPSGARVFATGTNHWARGLARNVDNAGEPDERIQQATVNMLSDMGARPMTPAGGIVLDPATPPLVDSTSPADGTGGVGTNSSVRATFDRDIDPASVTSGSFTLTGPGGAVSGAVSVDATRRIATLNPSAALDPFSTYTARLTTSIRGWNGATLAAPYEWSFVTGPGSPPAVTARTPAASVSAVFTDTAVTATFDRGLAPSTVTTSSVTLRPTAGGAAVPATVTYDDANRRVRLDPTARLAESTSYTARIATSVTAVDGTPLAAEEAWSFSTGTNVSVTAHSPTGTGVSPAAVVRGVFSADVDPSTLTATNVRLTGPGGATVTAQISYAAATRTVSLTPTSSLALSSTFTATLSSAIRGADGAPVDGTSWSFTTADTAPVPPTASGLTPVPGSTAIPDDATVRATFDVALDPATVTPQSFTLTPTAGGAQVAATVAYDAVNRRATLTPLAGLATRTQYTARLTTAIQSSAGAALSSDVTWSFTTADCPCSLFTSQVPAETGLPVRDGRALPGPWTYELGTKFVASSTTSLVALRFYKDAKETGTHVGRVWSPTGQLLAQTTFANETASGWQRQALSTPLTLQTGQTYTVSVNANAYYLKTQYGLSTPITNGPISTVATANGTFNQQAGQFPNETWHNSNYFVDVVAMPATSGPTAPEVTTTTPAAGATGIARTASVRATFNVPLDPSTVSGSSFTLSAGSAPPIAASVSYDAATRTATLTPSAQLEEGTAYTARLSTAIRANDQTPMAAPVSWTFSTVAPNQPAVTSTSPATGATGLSTTTAVRATFDQPMTAGTITATSFTLQAPGGASVPAVVTYDGTTRTATLSPNAPLAGGTTYTARLSTDVRSATNVPLAAPYSWTFTTVGGCPCRLFSDADTPKTKGLDVANGRTGTGPYSLELGVKVTVTQPASIEALRFYKDAGETGVHTMRIWNTSGTVLASTVFSGESASGWQQQSLATPFALTPGQTYVVSYGANTRFGMTGGSVLGAGVTSGPLRSVVDGRNGVFGDAAGTYPTQTWFNSNYFVDVVVR